MSIILKINELDSEISNVEAEEITFICNTENCDGEVYIEKMDINVIVGTCSKCKMKYKLIFKNKERENING